MNDKSIVEALLFVSNEPLSKDQLKEVLKGISRDKLERIVGELNQEYVQSGRSFQIEEIAGGWQMRTKPEFSSWIRELLNVQHRESLSGPALETLAIIAYKQPITKPEIESIRGVNADYIVNSLLERGLIRVLGRKDVVGKPFLYGTSPEFLKHFGLSEIKDLPEVEELKLKKTPGGKHGREPEEVTQRDK